MAVVGEDPHDRGSPRGYRGHSQAVGGVDHHRLGHRVGRSSLEREGQILQVATKFLAGDQS